MPADDSCARVTSAFERVLATRRNTHGDRRCVLWALLWTRFREFMLCALLKFIGEGFDFAGPLLLAQLLAYLHAPANYPPNRGYLLAGAMVGMSVARMLIMMWPVERSPNAPELYFMNAAAFHISQL